MKELPIACTLTPEQLANRRSGLIASLRSRAERVERMASGVRPHFAAGSDALQQIARTIDAERQCCQFLEFRLTVAPGLGPMTLEVSGPPGTADFLVDLLDGA